MRWSRAVIALLLMVLAAACDACTVPPGLIGADGGAPADVDAGPSCARDDDCPLGQQCVDGMCVPAAADVGDTGCTEDGDCAADELCALATGRCVLDAPTPDVPTGPPGPCTTGDQRTCGLKVGVCEYGVERCESGTWSGVCLGGVGPGDEVCNGVDDDCDTDSDEGFIAGAACSDGLGACQQDGVTVCTADGLATVCTAQGLDASGRVELCGNEPDDDCDGEIDEGFAPLGTGCTVGTTCPVSGTWACTADDRGLECSVSIDPSVEACDGSDNNGNSCVDEGFDLGSPCTAGAGACATSGVTVCNGAGDGVQCNATPGTPQAERCDNVDDDCNTVIDNGCDDDGDDYCDGAITFVGAAGSIGACPLSGPSTLDCNDANAAVSPGDTEICNNSVDEDCDGSLTNGCAACNPGIDADFDGSNQCNDCDETNGAVFPGAPERCDGLNQDCDAYIDEGFDGDGDGYTTCGTILPGGGLDASLVDCNDVDQLVHPGPASCELCKMGAAGAATCNQPNDRGTGVDEDCDGFVDETCSPCDAGDGDNDGVTGCQGDCNNADRNVHPGAAEVCDGKDTDCNRNTTENCDVGDPCNFAANTDECRDRLICVESLNAGGGGTGDFTCTSFCNLTSPGLGLGDSCDVDETCASALTPTVNLHGCAVTTGFGARAVGQACSRDSDCRSGTCLSDQRLTGPPDKYCTDLCTHEDSCPGALNCQASAAAPSYGRCMKVLSQQDLALGATCTTTNAARCVNGSASCADVAGQRRCREICCGDADCAGSERCALVGPAVPGPNGGVDTVALCSPDTAGNGGRPAGAACSANLQCESELCDSDLRVCIEPCCFDAMCPTGLICESALFELPSGSQTFARMCLNVTPSDPLEAL
ncbi:MAG: putative metal-binding motif-containing protein [Deltaproteobacteria bacterium]|nr:putative metal-binding motif-containing protein [Deltaproteobacteria bacterium]